MESYVNRRSSGPRPPSLQNNTLIVNLKESWHGKLDVFQDLGHFTYFTAILPSQTQHFSIGTQPVRHRPRWSQRTRAPQKTTGAWDPNAQGVSLQRGQPQRNAPWRASKRRFFVIPGGNFLRSSAGRKTGYKSYGHLLPIGSMYAIYANIGGI